MQLRTAQFKFLAKHITFNILIIKISWKIDNIYLIPLFLNLWSFTLTINSLNFLPFLKFITINSLPKLEKDHLALFFYL